MTDTNQLSERELEILRLVATGASNKDIAKELVISVNTVKVHLRNIFGKLEVSTRTEATIYAVQNGLVPSPAGAQSDADVLGTQAQTQDEPNRKRWLIVGVIVALLALLLVIVTWRIASLQNQPEQEATPMTAQSLEQDRWESLAEMPTPRSNFASAVSDDFIYVIGGETSEGLTVNVDRYNIETNTWESAIPLPEARADIQAAKIGGKIFVPGGRGVDNQIHDQLLVFDLGEGVWGEVSPLPTPLSVYALVAFEGNLYLFGGWNGQEYVDSVYRYDPTLDAWETMSPMPTTRGYAGAAVSTGKIYVVGGFDGDTALAVNEEYTPDQDDGESNPWVSRNSLPEARYRFRMVSVAEIIHLFGGTNDLGNSSSQFFKYYAQNDEWRHFSFPSENAWTDLGAEIVGEQIYIFGGHINEQPTDQHYSYRAIYSIMVPILP